MPANETAVLTEREPRGSSSDRDFEDAKPFGPGVIVKAAAYGFVFRRLIAGSRRPQCGRQKGAFRSTPPRSLELARASLRGEEPRSTKSA
jgi:hypothetical protein